MNTMENFTMVKWNANIIKLHHVYGKVRARSGWGVEGEWLDGSSNIPILQSGKLVVCPRLRKQDIKV